MATEQNIIIDPDSYKQFCFNQQQMLVLTEIFDFLADRDFTFYFQYDFDLKVYQLCVYVKDEDIELPYISRRNRIFNIDNLIIPERFLQNGENMIYILHAVLYNLGNNISLSNIIGSLINIERSE